MAAQRYICFRSFRLDIPNQQLWRDDVPVSLRPKSFAVLRYLVEHPNRLIRREELVKAVWPDTRGAEKAPKRCILELRAALGDDANDPAIIGTVGRLGYRFVAPINTTTGQPDSFAAESGEWHTTADDVVGRERELGLLTRALTAASKGERQIVLITGEPGIGKTSLVETFLQRVRVSGAYGEIMIGCGQCVEQYGEGEAYLPVLEALGGLAGKPDNTMSLEVLRRHAPSWMAQFPALLRDEDLPALQLRLQGATPQRMLREIADVIRVLTTQVPLVLVLEDIHWSDYSTLDFLAAVAQRQERARLMLIATYRSDIAVDHPLRPVAQELLAHGRAHELPLAGLAPAAVSQYLDTRFPRHGFAPQFAEYLHRWTEGNPLFLVNLVEDLIAQDVLTQTEETWTAGAAPETIGARVPENSRLLIAKQMDRLAPEVQQYLEAASIAGVEFAAAAVAAALEADTESVENRFDALVRRESFLRCIGVDEWPDGTRSTRYGYRHALYQQLWSQRVPPQRQQRFHLRIGERLECAYGGRSGEIAAELAVHFDQGRDFPRAVAYCERAAENAMQRSAHREAIAHLTRGLQLVAYLPDCPDRTHRELGLQIALSVPLTAALGYADPVVAQTYRRALELCRQAAATAPNVQALLGLWIFHHTRSELRTAQSLAEECLQQARDLDAPDLLVDAKNAIGGTLLWLGRFGAARDHLEDSVTLHDPRQHRSYLAYDATDPGVACLSHLAWALWALGYPDQALDRSRAATALAENVSHPYSLAYALNFSAALHCFCRETAAAHERASESVTLARDQGFPFWLAMGTVLRGRALVDCAYDEDGLSQIRQGMAAFHSIGVAIGRTAFLALLAEALSRRGHAEEGLQVLAQALAAADASDERLYEAEIHRLKGELTLQLHAAHTCGTGSKGFVAPKAVTNEAEGYFLKALDIARKQDAKSWELRAAMSISELWHKQKKGREAHQLLSEVYGWFTEGFDTPDLKQARKLLQELAVAGERGWVTSP